jgi:ATP-dependent exoDNAse (exonuclease V) alpha subunit
VNGTLATVCVLGPDWCEVEIDGGECRSVIPAKWSSNPDGGGGATFEQLPLRLAYAMTIHKSQGQTLDGAFVDINSASEDGQAYVAVSRVRKLAGLWLRSWPKWVRVNPEALEFYESTR